MITNIRINICETKGMMRSFRIRCGTPHKIVEMTGINIVLWVFLYTFA